MTKVPKPRTMPKKFKGKAPEHKDKRNVLITLARVFIPSLGEKTVEVELPVEHIISEQAEKDIAALRAHRCDYDPEWETNVFRHRR